MQTRLRQKLQLKVQWTWTHDLSYPGHLERPLFGHIVPSYPLYFYTSSSLSSQCTYAEHASLTHLSGRTSGARSIRRVIRTVA